MPFDAEGLFGESRPARDLSARFRQALGICALILAILPIPVTALGLLPAYRTHARFLMFYAPLVGLLTVGYCFYIRDTLARLVLANVLNPPSLRDPFYPEALGVRVRRTIARLRNGLLSLLPAGLVALSVLSTTLYTSLLNDSLAQAAAKITARGGHEVGYAPSPNLPSRTPLAGASTSARRRSTYGASALADCGVTATHTDGLRRCVLASAEITDIPDFTWLTVFYIGSFVGALGAVVVMYLKEHAKEALGLSEQDLVLGPEQAPYP